VFFSDSESYPGPIKKRDIEANKYNGKNHSCILIVIIINMQISNLRN